LLRGFLTAAPRGGAEPNKIVTIVSPEDNELTQAEIDRHSGWLHQGEADLPPIRQRLDALLDAMYDEGWTPFRTVRNEIEHLGNVLAGHFVAKYRAETLTTLDAAEIDLASWRKLSPDKQRELVEADERADAEAAERRKATQELTERKKAFYESMKRGGFRPSPELLYVLDNLTNPYV
jgi:hypothetical protein